MDRVKTPKQYIIKCRQYLASHLGGAFRDSHRVMLKDNKMAQLSKVNGRIAKKTSLFRKVAGSYSIKVKPVFAAAHLKDEAFEYIKKRGNLTYSDVTRVSDFNNALHYTYRDKLEKDPNFSLPRHISSHLSMARYMLGDDIADFYKKFCDSSHAHDWARIQKNKFKLTFDISVRYKDFVRASDTRHYKSCFVDGGMYSEQKYLHLFNQNSAIVVIRDSKGDFTYRCFLLKRSERVLALSSQGAYYYDDTIDDALNELFNKYGFSYSRTERQYCTKRDGKLEFI